MSSQSENVERNWIKSYSPGVPPEIDPDEHQSLMAMFEDSCKEFHDLPAFYCMGKTLTYSELLEQSTCFASYLQNELKLKKHDRVAIMLPNILQYPVVLFGTLMAGCIVVNVNPLYTASEVEHQLNDAGAETLVVLSNFAYTVEKAKAKIPQLKNIIVTEIGDYLSRPKAFIVYMVLKYLQKKIPDWNLPDSTMFKDALSKGKSHSFNTVEINNNDIAFLQYTGGTTGVSKGAELTHRNMIANIQQALAFYGSIFQPGCEIVITPLPLYHIFSLLANCFLFTKLGGLNVLIPNPRDIPSTIKEIKNFKFTAITGVNTLYNAMLRNKDFLNLDFSSLKLALGGGMAVQKVVADKWLTVTGKSLIEGYGLTETSPLISVYPHTITNFNGSVGLPVPSTDVVILDDNANRVAVGEAGEIAVKGPQVMRGYWNKSEENAKAFTKDGWFLTGDIGKLDENGFVYVLERKKDMILVSGFNVYPNEVESVIASMPGVLECAVVGVPDDKSGEKVKAFVVIERKDVTKEMIIKHCQEFLTSYKIPHKIEFVKELPKTNVGKILRRMLKDEK